MSSEETKKSTESDLTGSGQSKHAESQKPADNCDKNKTNKSSGDSQGACYCGKDRNLNIVELLCASCSRWFHESCISYQLGKLVPFMTNYLFICKNCSPTGLETFKKNQAPFPQMCVTAIANLQQESAKAGTNKLLFSKDREIIPFIDQYWEAMTTMPRRVTQSWYATVQRALLKEVPALFTVGGAGGAGGVGGAGGPAGDGALYGLAEPPAAIRPNYDHMIRQGQLKVTDMGVAAGCCGWCGRRGGRRRGQAARGGRGGGRRAAGGARLPQRAPLQQGRLPVHPGRARPARALPPGVRREPRVERQAHPGLAVPRAVPGRRAAGAARPRAAAARGRRPPGVLGRARLLRRARHARRARRRLVLGGHGARAGRGRRRAAGLGAALRQPAGAAGLRPLRLQLAQPQGHALPRVARAALRRALRPRRRAGLPAGAARAAPRAALVQGPAARQVQEPPVLRGQGRGGGGAGGAAAAGRQPRRVLPERRQPGRRLHRRVRGLLLPGRQPAPQHHRLRQLRARLQAPARRLRVSPDVGARRGGHLRADAGRHAVPGGKRGQAAARPLQPLTHVARTRTHARHLPVTVSTSVARPSQYTISVH